MSMFKNKKILLICCLLLIVNCLLFFAFPAYAAEWELLPDCIKTGNCGLDDLVEVFINFADLLVKFVGSVVLFFAIYGGFVWLTSEGSSEKVKKGEDILKGALIGLIIVLGAYTGIKFLGKSLGLGIEAGLPAKIEYTKHKEQTTTTEEEEKGRCIELSSSESDRRCLYENIITKERRTKSRCKEIGGYCSWGEISGCQSTCYIKYYDQGYTCMRCDENYDKEKWECLPEKNCRAKGEWCCREKK